MVDRSRLALGVALDLVAAAGCLGNTDEPTPASSTPEASLAADGGEVPGPPPGHPNLSVSPDGTLHVDFSALDRANWHRNLAGFLLQDAIASERTDDPVFADALGPPRRARVAPGERGAGGARRSATVKRSRPVPRPCAGCSGRAVC